MKTDHALLLSVLGATTAGICGAADASSGGGFVAWERSGFLGEPLGQAPAPLGLEGRRQDHGEFQRNQSVMKTPLPLGDKHYAHEQFRCNAVAFDCEKPAGVSARAEVTRNTSGTPFGTPNPRAKIGWKK